MSVRIIRPSIVNKVILRSSETMEIAVEPIAGNELYRQPEITKQIVAIGIASFYSGRYPRPKQSAKDKDKDKDKDKENA